MVRFAIIPVHVESCQECPNSVTWDLEISKYFCSAMKGKTFKDPSIVQVWCPYKGGE